MKISGKVNFNNEAVLAQIMQDTKQNWRKCKKKRYEVYACRLPANCVFANVLESPISQSAIYRFFNKRITTVEDCRDNAQLTNILYQDGFSMTNDNNITICGTSGELYNIPLKHFVQFYTLSNGMRINDLNMFSNKWVTVVSLAEAQPSAVGIYIPTWCYGIFRARDPFIGMGIDYKVNNPQSKFHSIGDILVVPMLNGRPNLEYASIVHNEVFSHTYDLNVGGWSSLDINRNKHKSITLKECEKLYSIEEFGLNNLSATQNPNSPYYATEIKMPS